MKQCDRSYTYAEEKWECYSHTKLKEKQQHIPYTIVGEITKKEAKERSVVFENVQGKTLYAQALGTSHRLYRPYAYIEVGKDKYVVVKKSSVVYVVFIVVLLLALIVGMFMKFTSEGPNLDPNAKDYTSKLKRPADWDASSILIPGYEQLKMEAGSDVLSAILHNPKENPCYFQYTIELVESGEKLYESGLIAPGKAVKKIPLSKRLERGIYPIVIKIDTYSLQDYEQPMNGGAVEAKIVAIE